MDDYLKVTKRTSAGISGRMKLVVQFLVAGSAVFFLMRLQAPPLTGAVAIPFVKGALIQLGWGFLLFGALAIVGSANALNLTHRLGWLAHVPVMIAAGDIFS